MDMPVEISKALPQLQLERALKFGAKSTPAANINIWVDAYLGFSQRLPLSAAYQERVVSANQSDCLKISLDIPTGFLGDPDKLYFEADHILSLAAVKNILKNLPASTNIYLADLGIPKAVYTKFEAPFPSFNKSTILKIEK
jgi:NAD(P)H-hydrate epimerase